MTKNSFILLFFWFLFFSCKGQGEKVNFIQKSAVISFEEKQKKDILTNGSAMDSSIPNPDFNFRIAAKKAIPGVVHIKSTYSLSDREFYGPYKNDFWYRFFYRGDTVKPQAEASGVIVSSDGYIVTNDHVVIGAEAIEIILLNQKSYKAKIIGIDTKTDLALLKIDETNLSFIEFGNSDEVEIGDWVLAVGNPFNLTSTVTAGIVSAKARNINLITEIGAVESYIQTDAAINPGNSGGALVDYRGKLIGINSAIATPTGSYAGYSFAIPVNIVKKVIDDLLAGGKVKRGYIGAVLNNMTSVEAKRLNTEITMGVYIDSLIVGGAAMEANLKSRDIITAIDEHKILTSAQFQEVIEQHRPGEKINLTVVRNGNEKHITVTLKEIEGTVSKSIVSKNNVLLKLGIKLDALTKNEKKSIRYPGGLKVVEISKGKIFNNTNIKKGFIITSVNGTTVNTIEEFTNVFENSKTSVMLEGVYPHMSGVYYFIFEMD